MKLHTTHIIQFSPIDLPTSDVIQNLQTKIKMGEILRSPHLTEGLSEYFSKALKFTNFTLPVLEGLNIEIGTLTVFEGGFGTYEITSTLPEPVTTTGLVEITDTLTSQIEECISADPLIAKISKFFGNWFTEDETDHNPATLMWAYSQSCVFETAENFERFSEELNNQEIRNYDDCRLKFDPTATVLFFNARDRLDTALQLLNSVTLSTALAYNIQNTAIKLSREILQDPNLETKFSSIDRYVRLVNIMDQYLTEIYQDDLIANLNEVVFAKPLAVAFELSEILQKAFKAVARLKDHVTTLENEISRRQQKRMNGILFTFTLLSVVSVSGGVISLYDFANDISRNIRVLIVILAFISASAIVTLALTRLGASKSSIRKLKK
jgi:hypothetical protein